MNWKTILVPHDFSESAEHAAEIAFDEAKSHGAQLVLLHVVELPAQMQPDAMVTTDPSGTLISVKELAAENAESALENIAQRLRSNGKRPESFVRFGPAADEITRFVDEHHIDLVVMGANGRTGLAQIFVGSVAERVVHTCKVPVLTVPAA